MSKKSKVLNGYAFYVWAMVILLVGTIMLVPFVRNALLTSIFGINIYYTPALISSAVLMGIIYAVLVSYETPKMSRKKKCIFTTIKILNVVLFYAVSIAVITFAALNGYINF